MAGLYSNTARLRLKYLAPTQDTKPFFWGVNLEAGYVPLRVSEDRYAAELRGFTGYRNGPWLLAVNPKSRQRTAAQKPRRVALIGAG